MESNVAHERFLGLDVYPIRTSANVRLPKDRASHCFHAQCQNPELNPNFKCDKCLFSHRHDEQFHIWLAHQRILGNVHG